MKHFDIIHCIDENYAPQCGVTITSICLNHMDVDITFHIMFANLSNSTKHKLVKQAESYGKSVKLYQIDIKELDNSPLGGGKELPIAAYFRLLATDYLPKDIHRALYLDVDIVVCKSLTDFYNTDLTNWPVAGVYDISTLDEAPSKRLDYDFKLGYINSGIMLINVDYWRKNNIKQKCLDFLEAYRDKLMFHDQDVLNGSLAGSIKIMPLEYNVQKHFYDPGFEKNMPAILLRTLMIRLTNRLSFILPKVRNHGPPTPHTLCVSNGGIMLNVLYGNVHFQYYPKMLIYK